MAFFYENNNMIIDQSLSQKIESCITQSHLSVVKTYQRHQKPADYFSVGSGAACFLGANAFLSQVIGWGFGAEGYADQLRQIEAFYSACSFMQVHIELSPLCDGEVITLLAEKGYSVSEVSNISIYDLTQYEEVTLQDEVIQTKVNELSEWAQQVAEGFSALEAKEQFELYAGSENILAFHLNEDGIIVAGATMAVSGDMCDLGVTSTLPSYRGRGLQKALLHARLQCAKAKGIKYACVTTGPGSISDINIQKLGFQLAYTRMKYSKAI